MIVEKTLHLAEVNKLLENVEMKFFKNQITHEVYTKWHTNGINDKAVLEAEFKKLRRNETAVFDQFAEEIEQLSDLRSIYYSANTVRKQQFVNLVFDKRLYYEKWIYRTPAMS